jgi:hypothetical protein
MRACLLAAVLAVLPGAAFAQINTSAGGALNTYGGGGAGAAIDTRANTGLNTSARPRGGSEPPIEVRRYVEGHRDVGTAGGSLSVGQPIPGDTNIRAVPGYPEWGYGTVNGQSVIVNRETNTISGVVGR